MSVTEIHWLNIGLTLAAWLFGAGIAWGYLKQKMHAIVADVAFMRQDMAEELKAVVVRIEHLESTDAMIFGGQDSPKPGFSVFSLRSDCDIVHKSIAQRDQQVAKQLEQLRNIARYQLQSSGLNIEAIDRIMNGGQ